VPWLNAVTEPDFYTAMGQGIMDPAGWLNMMNSMTRPNAYRNWASFLADPDVYMKWAAASMDPAFYTAILAEMSDPGKMMRWVMWPLDPKLWGLALNMFNPGLYIKWAMAPLDPRAWSLMGSMVNPATYMGFMGAAMDPRSYGPMWQHFLTYNPPVPPTASNPWASPPGGIGGVDFLNPNAWANILKQPQVTGITNPAEATRAPEPSAQAPGKVAEASPAVAPKPQVPAETTTKAVLSADTLFKINKSSIRDLSKQGRAELDAIAEKIKGMGEVEQIRIVGHADITGNPKYNLKLSEARARSVKSYLVAKGVKPGVIITSGMGSSQPVVQCDMSQPKAKLIKCLAPNRRVEIEVVGKGK
jgi:outer membrane protein OmpA-like peptidoglycan-associated protein